VTWTPVAVSVALWKKTPSLNSMPRLR